MLNLAHPLHYEDLQPFKAAQVLHEIRTFSLTGRAMHPDALKAVVLKLTRFSRDMHLNQAERDDAAEMASLLANAALKTYGPQSNFCRDLVAGIEVIAGREVA